jgi:hypothetical protein
MDAVPRGADSDIDTDSEPEESEEGEFQSQLIAVLKDKATINMDATEAVSETLLPVYGSFDTIKKCLEEV